VNQPLLFLDCVSKRFGTEILLDNVTLEVPPGRMVQLAGVRGAGKRKLLDLIVGNDQVDGGRLIFDGQDVTSWTARERCKAGLASPLQPLPLPARLKHAIREPTLRARLTASVLDSGERGSRLVAELVEQAMQHWDLLDTGYGLRLSQCSGGTELRAQIAAALVRRPKLIVLDEPFANFDDYTREDFIYRFCPYSGCGFLFSDRTEHGIAVSDHQYILENGRVHSVEAIRRPVPNSDKTGDNLIKRVFISYRRVDRLKTKKLVDYLISAGIQLGSTSGTSIQVRSGTMRSKQD
jgi:ABC-type lipopolysaccharide export system ATPase subunit